MEKKIYVITLETGCYDDYGVQTIAVTDDYERGLAYVNKKNAIFSSLEEKMKIFHGRIMKEWQQSNPHPVIENVALKTIPKWTGNTKITKEMREERKVLEKVNQELTRQANLPRLEWHANLKSFTEEWLKANLTEGEMEMYPGMNDNRWSIDESQWL